MMMRRHGWSGVCLLAALGCSDTAHRLGAEPPEMSEPGGQGGDGDGPNTSAGSPSSAGPNGGTAAGGTAGDDGGSSAAAGTGGGDPGMPPVGDDLSGTWDVVGTSYGGTSMFTVVLSSSSIHVTAQDFLFTVLTNDADDGYDVDYSYHGTHFWPEQATLEVKAAERTPFGLGAFPIDLGGSWSIKGVGEASGCSLWLADETAEMACTANGPTFMTKVERSALLGSRVSRLDSSFGNLGGEWAFTGDWFARKRPSTTQCSLRVEAREIEGSCTSSRGTQSFTAVFDGDDASGTGTDGFEFSAHRR